MAHAHAVEMLRLLSGYWFSQTLYVAAELGIADRLANGPKTAEALAEEIAVDGDALHRLLRALASAGIFADVGQRRFALTPLSETLLADREGSLRAVALLGGHPVHWQAWGELLHAVKTGEACFVKAHGQSLFDRLLADAELSTLFQQVLSTASDADGALVAALDLRARERIVDVGGGTGGLARRIAQAWPQAAVVLFDRAEALGAVPASARVEAVSGDFFSSVPEGADAYVLKFVLHDWNDRDAIRILANCRDAMRAAGRIFVIEVILPEGAEPSIAKTHDINMLVLTGGRERTLVEYRELFAKAGLTLKRAVATAAGASVLEAAPTSS